MIPKQTIDEIFQTARVEEVIGDFVSLKKSGSNYKAKSPFVDEKTPSFMISPAKQIWKCFSSGKGGNVVSFLMEHEHFSYVEALKWLASKYNIELKEDREASPEEIQEYSIRENLSVINEFAKNIFKTNIHEHPEGKAIGLSYFLERGFREDIIKKFDLGYCLDESNGFSQLALEKGYKLEFLEKAGLVKVKENRHFDFFRGRVMFPIHSVAGKILGFGGRTLKADKNIAKYFNSPESELYNKSKILYGLYFAKNAIIKYDNCFLVEGYTDVISIFQSGIENVVSSSGTSLTEGQINLIKRYTHNITILYDGDAAGIKASFRGIDMILEQGMNVKVVLFPDGEDPDSFAKKNGSAQIIEYIDTNAKDFIVFKSDVLLKDAGNDPIKKATLIRDIVVSISLIPDPIKRQVYTKECATIFEMNEQTLINELAKLRREKISKDYQKSNPVQRQISPEDEALLAEHSQIEKVLIEEVHNLFHQERDIIRILLNYGTFSIKVQNTEKDEMDANQSIITELSVVEFIVQELIKDDVEFENKSFQTIINEYITGFEDGVLFEQKHFIQHHNENISLISADILSEKHELSPQWIEKNVRINSEIDNLERAVIETIYSYKLNKIKFEIEKIQFELNKTQNNTEIDLLLTEQVKLEKIKVLFSAKLGRIII